MTQRTALNSLRDSSHHTDTECPEQTNREFSIIHFAEDLCLVWDSSFGVCECLSAISGRYSTREEKHPLQRSDWLHRLDTHSIQNFKSEVPVHVFCPWGKDVPWIIQLQHRRLQNLAWPPLRASECHVNVSKKNKTTTTTTVNNHLLIVKV